MQSYQQKQANYESNELQYYDKFKSYEQKYFDEKPKEYNFNEKQKEQYFNEKPKEQYFNEKPKEQYFNEKPNEQYLERSRTEEKSNTYNINKISYEKEKEAGVEMKINKCELLLQEIKEQLKSQKMIQQVGSINENDELTKYKQKYKQTKEMLKQSDQKRQYLEKQIGELQSVLQEKNNHRDQYKDSQQELNRIIQINQFLQFLLDLQAQLGVTVNITSYFPTTIFGSNCKLISETEFSFSKNDVIGQGGFSTVYKGVYNYKEVAIKVCQIEKNELQGMLEELFAQLSLDEFTVRLFAVHIPSSPHQFPLKFHLIMELMSKNLFTLFFVQKIQLSKHQKLQLLIRILEGINYLHSRNFVHCDLSLANIMVDDQLENVKLLDFGLAKYLQKGKTKKTEKLGQAARYSPREYLLGDNKTTVSTKCDIWSFGVFLLLILQKLKRIAYEILTEKQSWNWLQSNQIMVKIIQGVPFFDENSKTGVPAFDSILQKCLNHDYQLRPSALELKSQFQQLL